MQGGWQLIATETIRFKRFKGKSPSSIAVKQLDWLRFCLRHWGKMARNLPSHFGSVSKALSLKAYYLLISHSAYWVTLLFLCFVKTSCQLCLLWYLNGTTFPFSVSRKLLGELGWGQILEINEAVSFRCPSTGIMVIWDGETSAYLIRGNVTLGCYVIWKVS